MNKIYILSHKHLCECSHHEDKLIGTFFSKEEIEPIIARYKKLKGFRDYPDGFYIEEYIIDEIDQGKINQLIEQYRIN